MRNGAESWDIPTDDAIFDKKLWVLKISTVLFNISQNGVFGQNFDLFGNFFDPKKFLLTFRQLKI